MDSPVAKLWWKSPAAIGLGAVVAVCALGVIFEDKLVPQPKEDPRTHVPLPGGGSFCDPLPVQTGPPAKDVSPSR